MRVPGSQEMARDLLWDDNKRGPVGRVLVGPQCCPGVTQTNLIMFGGTNSAISAASRSAAAPAGARQPITEQLRAQRGVEIAQPNRRCPDGVRRTRPGR